MPGTNRLIQALKRIGASDAELESEERQRVAESVGADKIGELADRQIARLRGTIIELSMKPRAGTPWLEAEFSDGSGAVTLIWMGRREIAGVTAGREMEVVGRVSCVDGKRRLYNPRYVLLND